MFDARLTFGRTYPSFLPKSSLTFAFSGYLAKRTTPKCVRQRFANFNCSHNDDDTALLWPILFHSIPTVTTMMTTTTATARFDLCGRCTWHVYQLWLPPQWQQQRRRRLLVFAYSLLGFKVSYELAHNEWQHIGLALLRSGICGCRRRRRLFLAYILLGFKVSYELAHDERQQIGQALLRSGQPCFVL